ncbi:MAG: hypothetical protein B7Z47_01155, partial [Chthoniobacter sp. 12-60-6]
MRQFLLLTLGLSLFHFGIPAHAQTDDADLRIALEKVYLMWRDAMSRKDANAWAASITRYRQTVIRNSV